MKRTRLLEIVTALLGLALSLARSDGAESSTAATVWAAPLSPGDVLCTVAGPSLFSSWSIIGIELL